MGIDIRQNKVEPADYSGKGRVYTEYGVDQILAKVPGLSPSAQIYHWDDTYRGLDWRTMAQMYSAQPMHRPYRKGTNDCDKIAKRLATSLAEYWDEVGDGIPLAHGVLGGLVPVDGNSYEDGWHALCWFIDDEHTFWLYGAQERSVKPLSDIGRIQRVDCIVIGG